MHNNIFIIILIYIRELFLLYFIYMFNVLYYKLFFNKALKCIKIFKIKDVKKIYFTYVAASFSMDIILMLIFSRLIFINFFYFFFIAFIFKIIEIFFLKNFIIILNKLGFFNKLIKLLEFHYSLIMEVHVLKKNIYLNNNPNVYKFLRRFSVYNTFFFFGILYFKTLKKFLNNILFHSYLWLYTYYIRFLAKIKNNKRLSLTYNIKLLTNKLILKIIYIIEKIIEKIMKNYNIKMTIKYHYSKIKNFLFYSFQYFLLKLKNNIYILKELYFKYVINLIFFKILRNKGYIINYYIFLSLKYLKSFFFWLWDYDKMDAFSNFLKKFKRKKWK